MDISESDSNRLFFELETLRQVQDVRRHPEAHSARRDGGRQEQVQGRGDEQSGFKSEKLGY